MREELQLPQELAEEKSEYQKFSASSYKNEVQKEKKSPWSHQAQVLYIETLKRKFGEDERKSNQEKEYYFFEGENKSNDKKSAIKRFEFLYDNSDEEFENNIDMDADTEEIEYSSDLSQEKAIASTLPEPPSSSVAVNCAYSIKIPVSATSVSH